MLNWVEPNFVQYTLLLTINVAWIAMNIYNFFNADLFEYTFLYLPLLLNFIVTFWDESRFPLWLLFCIYGMKYVQNLIYIMVSSYEDSNRLSRFDIFNTQLRFPQSLSTCKVPCNPWEQAANREGLFTATLPQMAMVCRMAKEKSELKIQDIFTKI